MTVYYYSSSNKEYFFRIVFVFSSNMKSLVTLCVEKFFDCTKGKLHSSIYCLFRYIYILMNKREIYFLCDSKSNEICLEKIEIRKKLAGMCKHCIRLEKFNLLIESLEEERTFKIVYLIDQIIDFVLKYKKYYILSEFTDANCEITHFSG